MMLFVKIIRCIAASIRFERYAHAIEVWKNLDQAQVWPIYIWMLFRSVGDTQIAYAPQTIVPLNRVEDLQGLVCNPRNIGKPTPLLAPRVDLLYTPGKLLEQMAELNMPHTLPHDMSIKM